MPKPKTHKGLLKRIRVTKSGKIKLHRNYSRHLRSGKKADLLRSYRKPFYASASDVKRLFDLLSVNTRRKIARTTRMKRALAQGKAEAKSE
jgi:large subunit ribosomal protein L35